MSTMTQECKGFHEHLQEALDNKVPYDCYYRRCIYLNWDPVVAATTYPNPTRLPSKDSITSYCKREGISRRRYYDIKDELEEMGVSYNRDDIRDIIIARRKP